MDDIQPILDELCESLEAARSALSVLSERLGVTGNNFPTYNSKSEYAWLFGRLRREFKKPGVYSPDVLIRGVHSATDTVGYGDWWEQVVRASRIEAVKVQSVGDDLVRLYVKVASLYFPVVVCGSVKQHPLSEPLRLTGESMGVSGINPTVTVFLLDRGIPIRKYPIGASIAFCGLYRAVATRLIMYGFIIGSLIEYGYTPKSLYRLINSVIREDTN